MRLVPRPSEDPIATSDVKTRAGRYVREKADDVTVGVVSRRIHRVTSIVRLSLDVLQRGQGNQDACFQLRAGSRDRLQLLLQQVDQDISADSASMWSLSLALVWGKLGRAIDFFSSTTYAHLSRVSHMQMQRTKAKNFWRESNMANSMVWCMLQIVLKLIMKSMK